MCLIALIIRGHISMVVTDKLVKKQAITIVVRFIQEYLAVLVMVTHVVVVA